MTTLDQRLSASERLRRKADFEELYRSGRRLATRWFIAYVRLRDTGRMRLGVVASRRVGGAVARNRAKRLFREVFRKRKGVRLPADVVLVARPEVVNASYREVEEAYESTVYASLERGARTRR